MNLFKTNCCSAYSSHLWKFNYKGFDSYCKMWNVAVCRLLKGECSVFKKEIILWMKKIHYPNTIRSHLVTIVPMAPFTPKSTSKFRSALHFSYSIVIRRFVSRANTAQS